MAGNNPYEANGIDYSIDPLEELKRKQRDEYVTRPIADIASPDISIPTRKVSEPIVDPAIAQEAMEMQLGDYSEEIPQQPSPIFPALNPVKEVAVASPMKDEVIEQQSAPKSKLDELKELMRQYGGSQPDGEYVSKLRDLNSYKTLAQGLLDAGRMGSEQFLGRKLERQEIMPNLDEQIKAASAPKNRLEELKTMATLYKALSPSKSDRKFMSTSKGIEEVVEDEKGQPYTRVLSPRELTELEKRNLANADENQEMRKEQHKFMKMLASQKVIKNAQSELMKSKAWNAIQDKEGTFLELERLLDRAYKDGGQQLSQLGAVFAKYIEEGGRLTDEDVKRYINPQSVSGWIARRLGEKVNGKLDKKSYENLKKGLLEDFNVILPQIKNKLLTRYANNFEKSHPQYKGAGAYLIDPDREYDENLDPTVNEYSFKQEKKSKNSEIERIDPKTGKTVIYDAVTKKPLRWR